MRGSFRLRKTLAAAMLAASLCHAGWGQNLYGEDLARRLASPAEIREVTSITYKQLRRETRHAEPLFILTPPPFLEIPAAPPSQAQASARPRQWSLPPWAYLDPALPPDAPESLVQAMEARRGSQELADTWTEVPVAGTEQRQASVFLRPRPVAPGEEFVFRQKEIPPAFSLRRYHDSDENVFIEIAAYGGTTSFRAEEAFRAMKEAATKQEPLLGVGEEAFLTRVVVTSEPPPQEDPPAFDGPAPPKPPPFAQIAPTGHARPDLTDSARAVALDAPAFREVAVADLEGKQITFDKGPKRYVPKGGHVKQSLLVVVAFFPDQALTLSFAMEERLGNVQDLLAVALHAQRKLREEIVARD